MILSEVGVHSTSARRACRASRRSTLRDREKNSTIWSAALDELDELAELDDQKRLFTDTGLLRRPEVVSVAVRLSHQRSLSGARVSLLVL